MEVARVEEFGQGHPTNDTHFSFALPSIVEEEGSHLKNEDHPRSAPSLLNIYVQTYESAQRLRIDTMNRMRCWLRDSLPEEEREGAEFSDKQVLTAEKLPNDLRELAKEQRKFEDRVGRMLSRPLSEHPLWPWLASIRGIGPVLAGRLLHRVWGREFPSPAHLWSYAGLDGPGWKPRSRNHELTKVCWAIAESIQHQPSHSSIYRDIYEQRKVYEATRPWCGECHPANSKAPREFCTPGHINSKARRYAVKCFLKDLWVEMRRVQEEVQKSA